MATASGKIYRSGGKERVSYATIKTYKGGQTQYATASEGSEFTLDIPESGTWTFVALEEERYASDPRQVDVDQDQEDIKIYLDRIAETVDDKAGQTFFWTLLVIFGLLIIVFLLVHLLIIKPSDGFEIWSEDPLRYLEILFWGLAGILVSKIFTTNWYLHRHRFYWEGFLMHISHLVIVPLLVLVVVFILSLVTLSVTLAGSEVTLDLADSRVLAAVSFILGIAGLHPAYFREDHSGLRMNNPILIDELLEILTLTELCPGQITVQIRRLFASKCTAAWCGCRSSLGRLAPQRSMSSGLNW